MKQWIKRYHCHNTYNLCDAELLRRFFLTSISLFVCANLLLNLKHFENTTKREKEREKEQDPLFVAWWKSW